jgi:hypothetical protein
MLCIKHYHVMQSTMISQLPPWHDAILYDAMDLWWRTVKCHDAVHRLFQSAVYSAMKLVLLYICVRIRRYVPYRHDISVWCMISMCAVIRRWCVQLCSIHSHVGINDCDVDDSCMMLVYRTLHDHVQRVRAFFHDVLCTCPMDCVIMRTVPWWCDRDMCTITWSCASFCVR